MLKSPFSSRWSAGLRKWHENAAFPDSLPAVSGGMYDAEEREKVVDP